MSSVRTEEEEEQGWPPPAVEHPFDKQRLSKLATAAAVALNAGALTTTATTNKGTATSLGRVDAQERTLILLNRLSWSVVALVIGVLILAVVTVIQVWRVVDNADSALKVITTHLKPESIDAAVSDGLGSASNIHDSTEAVLHGAQQLDGAVTTAAAALRASTVLLNETNLLVKQLVRHPDISVHLGA